MTGREGCYVQLMVRSEVKLGGTFSCMTNRVYKSINTWGREGRGKARLGQDWGRLGVVSGLPSVTIYSSL